MRKLSIAEQAGRLTKEAVRDQNGCLNCSCHLVRGYGRVRVGGVWKAAHRVVWIAVNGEIPDGVLVLHSCDNPSCVEITHLHLGNHQDNTREMIQRERGARQKLNVADVHSIRAQTATVTNLEIAKRFGVHPSTISKIKTKAKWQHV